MFLPLAFLLLHPQVAPKISTSTEVAALHMPAAISASSDVTRAEASVTAENEVTANEAATSAGEPSAALPEAPVPVIDVDRETWTAGGAGNKAVGFPHCVISLSTLRQTSVGPI